MHKKHILPNVDNFQLRGICYTHLSFFVHYLCCLMLFNKKATENKCPIVQISPRRTSVEIRTFSENYTLTSSIRGSKLKPQKTIFLIFPKIGSGPCWKSPRTLHRFWCVCPVAVTFFPFLPVVPRGHFTQFWTKWIFENFEKTAKC